MRFLGVLALMSISVSGAAQVTPAQPKVRSELVVSMAWLADHLHDPNLLIIEVGGDPQDHYAKEHILGARFIGSREFIDDFDGEMGPGSGQIELPSPERLQAAFEKIGISNDSRIVIYSSNSLLSAARLFYTLDYVGLGDRVALLDGVIDQWVRSKRPVTADVPRVVPTKLTIHVNERVRATLQEVKAASEAKERETLLLDSRPVKWQQDHIPGANSLPTPDTVLDAEQSPHLKPVEDLRNLFVAAGATPGKKVITYCAVGLLASQTYFVAKYLGYDAALYDGSISEWRKAKMPTISGAAAR